jgi:hypothetical protein
MAKSLPLAVAPLTLPPAAAAEMASSEAEMACEIRSARLLVEPAGGAQRHSTILSTSLQSDVCSLAACERDKHINVGCKRLNRPGITSCNTALTHVSNPSSGHVLKY